MSESGLRRVRRLLARAARLPNERDWEISAVLEPRAASRHPELVSDGGGLPFRPAALLDAPGKLDREDPAVAALIAQLSRRAATSRSSRASGTQAASAPPAEPDLGGWRLLARTDREALFAHGSPPQLLTVAVRRDNRRRTWACLGTTAARPLRATRDGIRASSWRLDPTQALDPEDTVLRVLVTERTFAGGQPATGRVLPPDLYLDAEQVLLTMFVTPQRGFQSRSPNPETPCASSSPTPSARGD